jgi:hypothetical protein
VAELQFRLSTSLSAIPMRRTQISVALESPSRGISILVLYALSSSISSHEDYAIMCVIFVPSKIYLPYIFVLKTKHIFAMVNLRFVISVPREIKLEN